MDFSIQDLKDRRIGRVKTLLRGVSSYTPPDKDNHHIVNDLCSLNEATVKRQTTYEDLHMLKSVVRPQDFMFSLDVESVYWVHGRYFV